MSLWIELFLMLIVILISAQLFSNALEYFGEKIGVSSGVTGSIFAAIATALPETTIPLLAIIYGTSNHDINEEIGVGAILGAPLMLATLSTFLMAFSVLKKRGWQGLITPEKTGSKRDLNFFMVAFLIATIAMYLPFEPTILRLLLSLVLIAIYIFYLYTTIKASKSLVENGHGILLTEPLLFSKIGLKANTKTILLQLFVGLILLLLGAKGFINKIADVGSTLNVSVLILSLIIIPIATELPEKVNSILWIRKGKDTLAFGNITGAMVFQGTLLPAIGILLTPWQPNKTVLTGILITFIAAAWLRFLVSTVGLRPATICLNGLFYILYLCIILT